MDLEAKGAYGYPAQDVPTATQHPEGTNNQGYSRAGQYNNAQYELDNARSERNKWRMCIRVLSIIIMIFAAIAIVFGIIEVIKDLLRFSQEDHTVHYSDGEYVTTATAVGASGIVIGIVQIIINSLILYQGFLSFQTTRKDSAKQIGNCIRRIILFTCIYIFLEGVQSVITYYTAKHYEQPDDDMTEEDRLVYNNAIMTIAVTLFILSCCCLSVCCLGVVGFHYMYKNSQKTYELAERNVNLGAAPPNVYQTKQNTMV